MTCGLKPPISFPNPTTFLHPKRILCASLHMSYSSPHVFDYANFAVRFIRLKLFMFLVTGRPFYADYYNRTPTSHRRVIIFFFLSPTYPTSVLFHNLFLFNPNSLILCDIYLANNALLLCVFCMCVPVLF